MKQTHRRDVLCWSTFDEARNLDFHGHVWIRDGGNVLIDPVPMSEHDRAHLRSLGGADFIVVTNRDHLRATPELARAFDASVAVPAAERELFADAGVSIDRFLDPGNEVVPGLEVIGLRGSKTPGEIALLLERTTLVTGDLVRGHVGGTLNLLPDEKLGDKPAALGSLRGLIDLEDVDAVLVGDGWPVFRHGRARLAELLKSFLPKDMQ